MSQELIPLLLKVIALGAPFKVVRDRPNLKMFDLGFTDYVEIDNSPNEKIYALVQGAVQKAIALRGWYWQITMNDEDDYEADVTDPYTLDPNGYPGVCQVVEASNPAIALLTAFIAALQSEVTT